MIEVIVPFRGGCPYRERAWDFLKDRYPWPVKTVDCEGPWSKGAAVNPAVRESLAPILIVADADVWTEGLRAAVRAVILGAKWAIPHKSVHRLSREGTENFYEGQPWEEQPLDERAYRGVAGGGYIVAPRETLLSVPIDPRFTGWGGEDSAWGFALTCLYGPPWRGTGHLVHLYHPPQPRITRKYGSMEDFRLRKRYIAAKRNPTAMRTLLNECLSTSES